MRLFTNSNLFMNKSSADDVFNPRSLLSHREYVMIQQQKFSMCWQQTIKLSRFNKINRIPVPKSNFQFRYFWSVRHAFADESIDREKKSNDDTFIVRDTQFIEFVCEGNFVYLSNTNRYPSFNLTVVFQSYRRKSYATNLDLNIGNKPKSDAIE